MNRALAGVLAIAALLTALLPAKPGDAQSTAASQSASLAAFTKVASVLMSPRCQNCHTLSAFPTQGDDRHRHSMNVARGPDGRGAAGLRCATCHGRSNNAASGVPGADDAWHLAPLSMGWQGLSARELCLHLKDPKRNGGRTGAGVIDHLKTHLVTWAWAPGATAEGVARTIPPVSYDEFLAAAQSWVAGGELCPAPRS